MKLRREISGLNLQDGPLQRSHLRGMKYLQNVLKESKLFTRAARGGVLEHES